MDGIVALILGAAAAVFLHMTFFLLRFREETRRAPQLIPQEYFELIGYAGVYEAMTNQNLRWTKYLLFRAMPPMLTFTLFVGLLQHFELAKWLWWLSFASFALLHIFMHWRSSNGKAHFLSVALVRAGLLLLTLLIGVIALLMGYVFSFKTVIPSPEIVRDGLWTTLFAAIIAVSYLSATNMSKARRDVAERDEAERDLVRARKLVMLEKFEEPIATASGIANVPNELIVSMLVYEDLNRPRYIRWFERLVVKLTGVSLTVGIAQVKSDQAVSDEESIRMLGENLANGRAELSEYELNSIAVWSKLLEIYNGSSRYSDAVLTIYYC